MGLWKGDDEWKLFKRVEQGREARREAVHGERLWRDGRVYKVRERGLSSKEGDNGTKGIVMENRSKVLKDKEKRQGPHSPKGERGWLWVGWCGGNTGGTFRPNCALRTPSKAR